MAVIDCFTYFNEEEVLKLRLEELDPYVKYFVVVEASQTFTGEDKPYYFDELPSWINQWKDRIVKVRFSFPRKDMTTWEREAYQRNQILVGLNQVAKADDRVVMSDADEIPRPLSIYGDITAQLDVSQFFWSLNWQVPHHCNQGARPVVATMRDITTPHAMRVQEMFRINNAGWHFSFLGNDHSDFVYKIESFSHTEYNINSVKHVDIMGSRQRYGIDPFGRFPLKYRVIDGTYPYWVQEHKNELTHLMSEPPWR